MCNLYRNAKPAEELARLFGVANAAAGSNYGEMVFPGQPGLVIASGQLRTMAWGFPLVLRGKKGQPLKPKPVNNARDDKLGSSFWRASLQERRCLIPATAYAEAQGAKGAKTRTWISLPDHPLFAFAGLWRDSAEWGACYSMVTTEASDAVSAVHHRMPVIIARDNWSVWTEASADEALRLAMPYTQAIDIEATDTPWVSR